MGLKKKILLKGLEVASKDQMVTQFIGPYSYKKPYYLLGQIGTWWPNNYWILAIAVRPSSFIFQNIRKKGNSHFSKIRPSDCTFPTFPISWSRFRPSRCGSKNHQSSCKRITKSYCTKTIKATTKPWILTNNNNQQQNHKHENQTEKKNHQIWSTMKN